MNLSALIKKDGLAKAATATPATIATPEADQVLTVAEVATVAVTVKPEPKFEPKRQPASPELLADDESRIRAWLAHIEETDTDIIIEVLEKCRLDTKARAYFLARSEIMESFVFDDDRRYCADCVNLMPSGLCVSAKRGDIKASRTYHPVDDIPRRCEGYVPGPDDHDRRPGKERWPNFNQKG